ncbi:MAG: hypothetical protein PHG58_08375 [Clostridia bacterium]|nr:hypothetical protein [Clostridia bacterium]
MAFEEQLHLAEDKIAAFKSARKYQFIPSAVDGLKKYEENISIVASLKQEKVDLESSTIKQSMPKKWKKPTAIQAQDARRLANQKENDLHIKCTTHIKSLKDAPLLHTPYVDFFIWFFNCIL